MSQGPGKAKRGIPSKAENFNEWYPFMVEAAELVDKRYPIKGMDVWRPYGWRTMKLIDALTHSEMERTEHEEVNFPLRILIISINAASLELQIVTPLPAAKPSDFTTIGVSIFFKTVFACSTEEILKC